MDTARNAPGKDRQDKGGFSFGGPKRDGKRPGGKGGRGRDEASARPAKPSTREVVVDRRPGARVIKVSVVDLASNSEVSATYLVEFDGHAPIPAARLGEARAVLQVGPPAGEAAAEAPAGDASAPQDEPEQQAA